MKKKPGNRVLVATRTSQDLRDRLGKAAEEAGRSISQEVEHRLEVSFMAGGLGAVERQALVLDDLIRSMQDDIAGLSAVASGARADMERARQATVSRLAVDDLSQVSVSKLAQALSMALNRQIAQAERRWPNYEKATRPGRFIEGMKSFARLLNSVLVAGRRLEPVEGKPEQAEDQRKVG